MSFSVSYTPDICACEIEITTFLLLLLLSRKLFFSHFIVKRVELSLSLVAPFVAGKKHTKFISRLDDWEKLTFLHCSSTCEFFYQVEFRRIGRVSTGNFSIIQNFYFFLKNIARVLPMNRKTYRVHRLWTVHKNLYGFVCSSEVFIYCVHAARVAAAGGR